MKIFTSKSFTKKLIIAIVVVLLVTFTLTPNYSNASLGENITNIFLDLFLRIGDGVMWLIHKIVFGFESSMYTIPREDTGTSWWKKALLGICGLLAAAAWIAGGLLSGGVLWVVSGVVLVRCNCRGSSYRIQHTKR